MWGHPLRIARLAGFDIKIDASWLIIAALIVWSLATGYFAQKLPGSGQETLLLLAVIAMLGLFASLIFHEMAHALMARQYGVPTTGITLFLFGGVAELASEPTNARDEFYIAIVGPLASLFLSLFFWSSAHLASEHLGWPLSTSVLHYLAIINLTLALFNLLPAFPLDGGRAFRAFLWARSGDLVRATRQAVRVSSIFSWLLIALGLSNLFLGGTVMGLWPVLIGLFLLAVARGAYQQLESDIALSGRTVGDLLTRKPMVADPEMSIDTLVNTVFLANAVSFAPVVENSTLLGYVDTQMVRRIDRENWRTTTVEDVFESTSNDNCVAPEVAAKTLMERIAQTGRRKYLVVRDSSLVGVITLSDFIAFLAISKDLSSSNRASA
ncbi:MAG: site-2 protease family protein [Hyphomicrobiales bacterium]|jgi:Zn-dependent protease/predicted transcriptional regulator